MPDTFIRRVTQIGAVGLGAILYVFILLFDLVAALVNTLKRQLHLPQLTDFRRHEEESLHIPVLNSSSKERITLNQSTSSSADTVTFTIPPLEGSPNEVLVEVGLQQDFKVNTEVELSLSNTAHTLSETVFLFMRPFNHAPELQYQADQLWFDIPVDRTLELACTDVQPRTESVRLSGLSMAILDWR